jgi:molybdopterin synthase catalytic subunit
MKVKIESSLRDAGTLSNFLNRDGIEALLEKKLVSSLGNLVVFMGLVREAFLNFFSKARLIVSFVALIGALE